MRVGFLEFTGPAPAPSESARITVQRSPDGHRTLSVGTTALGLQEMARILETSRAVRKRRNDNRRGGAERGRQVAEDAAETRRVIREEALAYREERPYHRHRASKLKMLDALVERLKRRTPPLALSRDAVDGHLKALKIR